MDIPSTLSAIGAIASAAATVVLVFLTGKYVKLTHALVEESRQTKYPNVFIDIEFDEFEAKFLVGNTGTTPALDISFNVTDRVPWRKFDNHPSGINSITAIQKGISYLAPGRILKFNAGHIEYDAEFFAEGSSIEISINFKTEEGKQLHRQFAIDLQSYSGILLETFRDPQREVARAIRDSERDRRSEKSMYDHIHNIFKKICPTCGEQVSPKAKKCPHCHETITESTPNDTSAS